ncbi:MAG: MBL fold metallo-hydrolase [Aggregatilineales bacterium]
MLQLGDLKIHLINDADSLIDPGGAFGLVPRVLWSQYFPPNDDHLIPMSYNCLYVETGDHKIVIDNGFGTKMSDKEMARWQLSRPQGDLVTQLAAMGVQAEDITLMIDTHLHSDHCSGNTKFADDGETLLPTFPNAEYVVQRREYEDAMHPNERTRATYFPFNYELLIKNGQMRLLDGDTDLAPGIRGIVTPGHTPAHMSVRFESNDQHAAFLCDLASYAVHFERLGWMTAYDVEPLRTLETKREWQQWALETNAVVMFPHDPFRPAGRLTHDERGRTVLETVEI